MRLDRVSFVPLALLGLACTEPPRTAAEQAERPPPPPAQPTSEQTQAALPPRPPPPPLSSGRLWANVRGVGVHVLDARGWRELHSSRQPIVDMARADGELWLLSSFGVSRLDARGQANPLAPLDKPSYMELGAPMALAMRGREPWVLGASSLGRWGDAWRFVGLAEGSAPTQLAVDAQGRAWLGGARLWQLEPGGDALTPVEQPQPVSAPLLATNSRGQVVALHGCQTTSAPALDCQLLALDDDAPPPRSLTLPCRPTQLVLDDTDARSVVIASGCGLVSTELRGDAEPVVTREGWEDQQALALALDSAGRRWLGTHEGLRMVDTRGVSFDFPLAQLGPMAGAITQVRVEGEGPTPPELGLPRHGGLEGTLVRAGDRTPLAGAKVQLCTRLAPAPSPSSSPCVRVGLGLETTTDAQGRFELPKVPLAHYVFGVEVDGRWSQVSAKLLIMRQSMTANVGKLELPN